ncbi:uncharacterized protein LOC105285740 isoform X2 [Ooceraea biroi]|uniref:uncharacterized protein LOC105285740 isoform X2 n=1 Tax=Ooceraea biroi TaxID=2015173 RepID=UPI000F0979F1|nr:uncharacterized protein LOC105285740 isoform X2 [Ooceraea biroi]
MIFVKSPFYNINRIILLLLGIWPYQKSKFIYVQRLFSVGIFISFVACQLLLFVTEKHTVNLFFTTLSQSLPILICLLKYNAFFINSETVKILLEQIQHDWNTLNGKELEIMKQYLNNSRLFMIIFTSFATMSVCAFTFIQLLPVTLDVIIPLNVSRPRRFYFRLELFINKEKYFYVIAFYTILSLCVSAATIVSTGASLLTFGQHSCAMLKIACYRMEHAMDKYKVLHIAKRKEIQNKIVSAVDIHRKAAEYADILISPFMISYIALIVIGVISLSFNLFCFFQAFFYTHDMQEVLVSVSLIGGHFLYMFCANYGSQVITDHFEDIFIAAYGIPWYVAPVRIQKLVMLLLQRSTKTFVLQIGGLFIGSLEGFTTVMNLLNQTKNHSFAVRYKR